MGTNAQAAAELHVRGVVQGVGFRPFVHRLAMRHALAGWVRNESGEVRIEVEGDLENLWTFVDDLVEEAPPLARLDELDMVPTEPVGVETFQVGDSVEGVVGRLPVAPDVAICSRCREELFDPENRRYRYPFITCTDCGPRLTVIDAMPYDRIRTSMRVFPQCTTCREEYESPGDRRYHSETNCCHDCGPQVWLLEGRAVAEARRGRVVEAEGGHGTVSATGGGALAGAARLLRDGAILAVRGLGGFHLAVDATNEAAVRRLRECKSRPSKPLAVMVESVTEARALGEVNAEEERLLTSLERPVVLLRKLRASVLAASVAPGLDSVGVMTAYTPLHLLLMDRVDRPLVMTSGNASEEPIAIGNGEALERLGDIADAFLLHNRGIVTRCDDTVARVVDGAPVLLRRARGYAPMPLALPFPSPKPMVAVGAHLKSALALSHGQSVYVSQHIGDLENFETLEHFQEVLKHFRILFNVDPKVAVRDRHPGYLSSRIAEELGLERVVSVQHHHAHVAAVAAEHGVCDPVIGVAYDGTGYGDDGRVWGAEILAADLREYRRMARLRYAPLPGGDAAVRQPWRTALGYASLDSRSSTCFEASLVGVSEMEVRIAERQIERGLNAPMASSMGRLFDAAAAVLGLRQRCSYEGEAAMILEAVAGRREAEPLPFPADRDEEGLWIMNPLPLLIALEDGRRGGRSVEELAAAFHESIVARTADLVGRIAEETDLATVALGGGCFQNARLLSGVRKALRQRGLQVLVPEKLGPNDGAVSFGQTAVAAAVLRSEEWS